MSYRASCRGPHRAFTLIEMLVVIAIITIILGVTVVGQKGFDSTTVLSGAAYDVALSVRQAQVYGLSGRGMTGTTHGYGIDFRTSQSSAYTLFQDTNGTGCYTNDPNQPADAPSVKTGNCLYDPTYEQTTATAFKFNNGIHIAGFCAYDEGASYCSNGGKSISQLDITFARPEPAAVIYATGASAAVQNADAACVEFAKGGATRYLLVERVGTITVLQTPGTQCPNLP